MFYHFFIVKDTALLVLLGHGITNGVTRFDSTLLWGQGTLDQGERTSLARGENQGRKKIGQISGILGVQS